MKARDVYEVLVGADSAMGVGDFKDLLNKKIGEKLEGEGGSDFSDEESEELLRAISDSVANEDEFDTEETEVGNEIDSEDDLDEAVEEDNTQNDEEMEFPQQPGELEE